MLDQVLLTPFASGRDPAAQPADRLFPRPDLEARIVEPVQLAALRFRGGEGRSRTIVRDVPEDLGGSYQEIGIPIRHTPLRLAVVIKVRVIPDAVQSLVPDLPQVVADLDEAERL